MCSGTRQHTSAAWSIERPGFGTFRGRGINLPLLLDGDAGPLRYSFERVWIVEGLSHPCRDPIHLDDGEGFRPSVNETVKDAIEILRRMRLNEGDRWGRA
jgi:hypothetical protein